MNHPQKWKFYMKIFGIFSVKILYEKFHIKFFYCLFISKCLFLPGWVRWTKIPHSYILSCCLKLLKKQIWWYMRASDTKHISSLHRHSVSWQGVCFVVGTFSPRYTQLWESGSGGQRASTLSIQQHQSSLTDLIKILKKNS